MQLAATRHRVSLLAFGMHVQSDIAIAGSLPWQPPVGSRAHIARCLTVACTPEPGPPVPFGPEWWESGPASVRYGAPGIVNFDCAADRIDIQLSEGADEQHAMRLLIANALPAVLWLRGLFALHASAIRLPGCSRAWAVCGPSGAGKSTVALSLLERGASFLADDVVALDLSEPREVGDDHSLAVIGSGLPSGTWRLVGDQREFRPTPPARRLSSSPIGGLILLDRSASDAPASFERMDLASSVEALLAHRHRPHVPAAIGKRVGVFDQAVQLAKTLPMWRWRRPDGHSALNQSEFSSLCELIN